MKEETGMIDGPNGRIAYRRIAGDGPCVVWFGGFKSDMTGTKAEELARWASAAGRGTFLGEKPADSTFLEGMVDPEMPLSHLTEDELAVYAAAYERSGWHGPINRYRAQDLDAADIGHLDDDGVLTQPAAFVGGAEDAVRQFIPGLDLFDMAPNSCGDYRGTTIVDGAGHWVQQERPAETNAAIDAFLQTL